MFSFNRKEQVSDASSKKRENPPKMKVRTKSVLVKLDGRQTFNSPFKPISKYL